MKLKNMLLITFLVLTIIPIMIVSILLYKSGFELSKESYTRNLAESLNVQVDYISQTIENDMISDYRFSSKIITPNQLEDKAFSDSTDGLHTAVTSYLVNAEDKIAACIILDPKHLPVYSIGEKMVVDTIRSQLPQPAQAKSQTIIEFDLGGGMRSLGIFTPIWQQDTYMGGLVSVYDKAYIFKIISSYYEIADTSTYICRENGDIINSRQLSDENSEDMQKIMHGLTFSSEGAINTRGAKKSLSGYYNNISNTPWYLVGFVDDALIYSFTNQFLIVYIFIILGVLIIDVVLAIYVSREVVKPINSLIKVMEGYQNSLDGKELQCQEEGGYVETKYLRTKFSELMKKILLVQHNFEGVYQLYQSNDTGDTNVDIDVTKQTISSNKDTFQKLINDIVVPTGACVVERFSGCFCDKDRRCLMTLFEAMRDEQLSVTKEVDVYTPYLNEKWFHILVVPMYNNERLSRLFIQLRDISGFKKQELESSEQIKRDALTGLYNRVGFASCVDKVLQNTEPNALHALLFIDMDYFKLVNDNFGHTAGDEVLRSVARTLVDSTDQSNYVCRFGGDEFVMFLECTSAAEIANMEKTLKERLIYPFNIENTSFTVSASIGVSTWSTDSPNTLEKLLEEADTNMYKSKREFKQNLTT